MQDQDVDNLYHFLFCLIATSGTEQEYAIFNLFHDMNNYDIRYLILVAFQYELLVSLHPRPLLRRPTDSAMSYFDLSFKSL